ncbi:MAG TPA: TonB-dependent receptor [Stellaceae bacterium]|nr:TonB-dependent receptor [Stellaceae bacterium]
MRLPVTVLLAAAFLVPAAAGAAHAQSIEELRQLSLKQLGEVEITSVSLRPEPLSQAVASVYVISHADILRSGATTLPEVLRLAPNLEVARLNAFTYTITARGFSSPESANKLLVLIDGRSVYSPLGSTVFWDALDVNLDDVERIEIVSGPGGTLYGANAVNGVINVVTRGSSQTQGGLADLGGGTIDRHGTVRYGGRLGDFATYRVYGVGFQQGDTTPVLPIDRSHDSWHGGQAGFRADGKAGADAYVLEGDIYNNQVDGSGRFADDARVLGGSLTGHWTRRLDADSSLALLAYYSRDIRVLPGSIRDELDTYDAQIQYNLAVGAHQIVSGAEFRTYDEGVFSAGPFFFPMPREFIYLGNVFAQDEIALRPDLKLTLGSKLETDSLSGPHFLPTLRLGWQAAPGAFLWSAVSRAVRTPSRIDQELQSPGFLAPAPHFGAETLTAFEAGARGQPLPQLTYSISAYYNLYDGIRADELTNGGLPIVLGNGIAGDTYGVEMWGTYQLLGWWRLKPGFEWLHKNFHLKPGATDFSQFQAIGQDPSYQALLRSEMDLPHHTEFDVALREVGPISRPPLVAELVPGYIEADARIAWHATKVLTLSLEGSNLLHARHLEAYDPSTTAPRYIPRTVFVRLRTRF